MVLDARIEAQHLKEVYHADPRQQSFNLLLLGEKGSGKTSLLRTARWPVHIDSFDPGGTIPLRDLIDSGDVVADTQYEYEDPYKPTAYKQWLFQLDKRIQGGYFNTFGTYCLDSATSWGDAILYWVQSTIGKKADGSGESFAGQTPKWNRDYKPQRTEVENCLRKLLSLPCDVIVTGHFTGEYETTTNAFTREVEEKLLRYVFHGVGATKTKVPTFFSELWITQAQEGPKGNTYRLLTQHDGYYRASTRLGRGGTFLKFETPNIKALLKKAGWPHGDKPRITNTNER
jgi:hypothetical protein